MDQNFNPYKRNQFYRKPLPQFYPQPRRNMEENVPMQILNYPGETSQQDTGQEWKPNKITNKGYRNLNRLNYGPDANFEQNADKIVQKMEKDETLMNDTPVSEQLRKEVLRELPECITVKRCVKRKLTKSISLKSKHKPISWAKSLKYSISITFCKFKDSFENFNYFELWYGTLKDIEGHFGSGYASYFKFLRWLFVLNCFLAVPAFAFIAIPQILYDVNGNAPADNTTSFQFKDIFVGNGFFRNTILYYGHYTNLTFTLVPHLHYDMPAAYFSVILIIYLISCVILSISVAMSYRRTFIETEGGLKNVYANKIFCGWDFGIATKEAAELKSASIYQELKELLSESLRDEIDQSFLEKFWIITIQLIVNIFIIMLLAGVGWVLWLLLEEFSVKKDDDSALVTAVLANIIMMILPLVFSYISKYEGYKSPRTVLYITLIRTFLLGFVLIGVIFTYHLIKSSETECWETHLGEEVYRLILFDFIFCIVLTTLLEVGYLLVRKIMGVETHKHEFNVAKYTLHIIYNQGLFWVGLLYSPVLPIMVVVKMIIMWYISEGYMRRLCKPPSKTWRAAQTHTWFLMMAFISIFVIVFAQGYVLKYVKTSASCGPFSNYEYMYEMITRNWSSAEEDRVWKVVGYLTKPGAVALIMIAISILVYYMREKAEAQKKKVEMLREMLIWQAKDKKVIAQLALRLTQKRSKGDVRNNYNRFADQSQIPPGEGYQDFHYDGGDTGGNSSRFMDEGNSARQFNIHS